MAWLYENIRRSKFFIFIFTESVFVDIKCIYFRVFKSPVFVGHAYNSYVCLTRVNARLFGINTDKPTKKFGDMKHTVVNTSFITCYLNTNLHIPCRAPAVSCRANLHIPCRAPAVLRHRHVLRESPRVAKTSRTANRETPRGSRKKLNQGRSPTGRRETADVNSHVPCRVPAVALRSRCQNGMVGVGQGHGMVCV
jgi:hypothetical protein